MNAHTPPARLAVDDLTVTFGGLTAVDGASFDVQPGEVVALIGPNGAGKTTVFNAICGLVRSRGTVRIDGRPAPRRAAQLTERGVARTLQGLGLFPSLTVRENVALPARDADLEGLLSDHALTALADRPVAALSYPDRKRVALARALASSPRLLMLDEPAGGLGPDDVDALADTVCTAADAGCSVLLVEHNVGFVMGVADRIVVLDFGRVIACGTPDEVRRDPRVEEAYLGVAAESAAAPTSATDPSPVRMQDESTDAGRHAEESSCIRAAGPASVPGDRGDGTRS